MSDNGVYTRLAEHFPASAHKTKPSGGRELIYVDGEMVVSRLNESLGFDGWSFEVGQVNVLEDEVWVTGKLTVYSGDRVVVREQAGGQIINRTRGIPARPYVPADGDRPEQPAVAAQKGQIVELGNDIKGAITDCLKKCATLVGVGLYLFDAAERREVEQEMREAKRQPKTTQKVEDSAKLTGAAPTPIDTARVQLVTALNEGVAYAASIGLTFTPPDVKTLSNAELAGLVEGLREQCRQVLAERKKKAAKQQAEQVAAS